MTTPTLDQANQLVTIGAQLVTIGQQIVAGLGVPPPVAPPGGNLALSAVAASSGDKSVAYPVGAVKNGDRKGLNWGSGGGWNSAGPPPAWVTLTLPSAQPVSSVIVYTLQDSYANPVEPTDTLTFSLYGVTDFSVQTWDGAQWVTQGSVSGNTLVKRTTAFPATVTTSQVRVYVTGVKDARYARIVELEVF